MFIARTPDPPYYAVIFTSIKSPEGSGYHDMADKMYQLAQEQDGFLGVETARTDVGITISYWRDLEAIKNWKLNLQHLEAQKLGKKLWYKQYMVRVCKVERDYGQF